MMVKAIELAKDARWKNRISRVLNTLRNQEAQLPKQLVRDEVGATGRRKKEVNEIFA